MDKWTMIILEAEDMWASSAAARSLAARDLGGEEYKRIRDEFKARRIYDLYGYEWFLRFLERCPHIARMGEEFLPCNKNDGQCSMFCLNYKGGCSLCQ